MRRKQITSLLLSSILALSAMATPFTQLPVYAAEATSDAVEGEEAGADAGSDKSEADASDEGAGEADGGNQTEGNQSDETGEASGGNSENGNSGTTDGETVADTGEDEDSGEVSGDDNTGENIEAADDEETVEDSEDEDGTVVDEEAAAGETKDEADGDFIFGGVVSATTEGQETVPEENGGESPDDLFADYVEKSFNGELSKTPSLKKRGAKSAGSNLSGIDRAIYNNISACLPQIAAGERASTVFEISVDELGLEKTAWTAEELGIASVLTLDENGNVELDENGYASISPEAVNAVSERTAFDLSKITRALLADNPYQLYWYEKTQSTTATGFGLTASYDNAIGDYLVGPVGSMSISFPVANEYSAGEYMVDTTIGQAVQTSVANANAIVSQYSSATDYDKLSGYKEEICDLVSYNDAAAEGGVSYGNPWQMIWVFDHDPTTNVVCEGYAKAFKYLCDQSNFNGGISCITVTGTMSGGTGEGPHMWNIVNMEDGKNYLVDVTNCDEGTIGEPDQLFLVGYDSGDFESGYTFRCGSNNASYIYDSKTIGIYTTEDLLITDNDYSNGSSGPDNPEEPEVKPDPLNASVLQYHIDNGGVIIDKYTGGEANSIVIPDTIEGLPVVKIGSDAFSGHYDITGTLYLPDTIEVIGFNAFSGTGLQKINKMPSNLRIIEDQAFNYNLSMRGDLVLPASTEHIGKSAFDACYFDGILQLNEGLVSIGDNAFTNCQFKGDLIIPSTVTEMGRAAFSGSQFDGNLIILSENLEEIPDLAFYYCDKLSGITIPDGIKCINYWAFCHCHSLNGDLVIPASVEEIGSDAFYQCSFGGRLVLNDGLKVIRYQAFYSCNFEGNLELPSTMAFIGDNAFAWNNFSGSVVLPDGLQHIGAGAFQATTLSGSVTIPDSVISVGKNAFNSIYGMEVMGLKNYVPYFEFESLTHAWNRTGYELTSYNNSVINELTLPQIYNGIPIYRIGMGAFYDCDGLTGNVIIPEGYKVIDIDAFKYCNRMTSISLPSTIETICTTSFEGCTALTDVYYKGTRLQALELAKGCLTVKDIAWHCTDGDIPSLVDPCVNNHTWNEEYTIDRMPTETEDGIESIHCSVCGAVKEGTERSVSYETGILAEGTCGDDLTWELTFSGTLTINGTGPMQNCSYRTAPWYNRRLDVSRVIIGNSVALIGSGAFEDCSNLVDVEIPQSVTEISESAFQNCKSLRVVTIPDTVTQIGGYAFSNVSAVFYVKKGSVADIYLQEEGLSINYICDFGHTWNEEYTVDKKATCTEEGSESIHCSVCGVSDENTVRVIPAKGHTYGDWTVTKEATCTEAGSREKVCASCGDKVTEETPATGHDWSEWTVVREATEEEEGLERRNCSNDPSHTEERTIPKLTHVHELTKTEAKEASCTEDGNVEFWICSKCGRVYSDSEGVNEVSIEETIMHATGHKWNTEYTVDTEATCTEEGSESLHCAVCGVSDENSVRTIPAKGHKYGDWTVTKEATCTEAGSKEKVCASCGDKVTEEIPATGHAYGVWTVTKEATCTEAGNREKACASCGDKVTEEIPATGHAYGDWTVTKEATCTEAGSREKACANCGDKITEEIPAKGHQWNESYTVDVAPTYTEEGTESIHCSVCDEIQEGSARAVAKLRKPVSMLEISGIVDKNYNGKAQTQAVVVMDGDITLVDGTDYTVSYKSNTNAGTASVIITGIGNYTGSVTKEFTIKKIANTITAKSFTRTYSTKAQSFDLGVKIKSGTPAYKSSSSSVTVSKAGKATVKAKFMGKVTITITAPASANYTATTKKITITVNPTKTALVSVTSPSAGKMTVKWKKNAVSTGYQIQYSTSSKFTSPKTVTITKNSTLTRTIGSLAKGKKYYVRIRTYKTVGSVKFYSGWSAAKAVTVKK